MAIFQTKGKKIKAVKKRKTIQLTLMAEEGEEAALVAGAVVVVDAVIVPEAGDGVEPQVVKNVYCVTTARKKVTDLMSAKTLEKNV